MKAEYFAVVFCLLFAGAYFTYVKRTTNWGTKESSIIINGNNFREEIKYSGVISFSEDETSFESISPGGYVNFSMNGDKVLVKSNEKGLISYEIFKGSNKLSLDSSGKMLIREAVAEMIARGINATARMERIYSKGGNQALIQELDKLKSDEVKMMYVRHLVSSDSLSTDQLTGLLKKLSTVLDSDQDREAILKKITPRQLRDSAIQVAYLAVVNGYEDEYSRAKGLQNLLLLGPVRQVQSQVISSMDAMEDENEKSATLLLLIDRGQPDTAQTSQMLEAIGRFRDDMLKEKLLLHIIKKDSNLAGHFDTLLDITRHMGGEMQKESVYRDLAGSGNLSQGQWISLIGQTAGFTGDAEKSGFLLELSSKMPKGEEMKTAYIKAAKNIQDDFQYGRALRAIE